MANSIRIVDSPSVRMGGGTNIPMQGGTPDPVSAAVQRAIQAGYSPEEIQSYLAQKQGGASREGLIAKLLPLIGSIVGGTLAAPLPGGVIWGSALGSGLGETGRQALGGGNYNIKKILGETGMGALGGGAGMLLGGIGRAGQAATEVAGQAGTRAGVGAVERAAAEAGTGAIERAGAETAGNIGENLLTKVGKGLIRTTHEPLGVRAAINPTDVQGALKAENIAKGLTRFSGSGKAQYAQLGQEKLALNETLGKLFKGPYGDLPVDSTQLTKNVLDSVAEKVDINSSIAVKNLDKYGNEILGATTKRDVNNLFQKLSGVIQSTDTTKEQRTVLKAIQSALSDNLKTNEDVAQIFGRLSQQRAEAPVLNAMAKKQWYIPGFNFRVSSQPAQAARADVGQGLEKTGNFLSRNRVPLTLGAYQAGARGVAGNLFPQQQYTPTSQAPELSYLTPQTQQAQANKQGFNITPEQVAMARLTMPKKKADALEAAYKIMNPAGTTPELAAKDRALVMSGLQSLSAVEKMLQQDPSVLTRQLIPGKYYSREYDAAVYNMADAILRLRTGAQANPSEIKGYGQSIAPSFGDNPDAAAFKLDQLKKIFQYYLVNGSTATTGQ